MIFRAILPLMVVLGAALMCVACSGGRGVAIDAAGEVHPVTGEYARMVRAEKLRLALADEMTGEVEVRIEELPQWRRNHRGEDWLWERASVLIGRPADKAPDAAARRAMQDIVEPIMRDWMTGPGAPIDVRFAVLSAAQAAADAPSRQGVSRADAIDPVHPAVEQIYIIQHGDTLAQISAVFYGTARYWRRIVNANPGLDATQLRVGQQIVIPRLPKDPAD